MTLDAIFVGTFRPHNLGFTWATHTNNDAL